MIIGYIMGIPIDDLVYRIPSKKENKDSQLEIDFEKHIVKMNNKPLHLTQIEFKILRLLTLNAGRVLSYETIIQAIWGPYADKNNQILRVNMANIRKKLEENPSDPKYIFTVSGLGYRMIDDRE